MYRRTVAVYTHDLFSPGVVPACNFPGSVIYMCMQTLLRLNTEYTSFIDGDR